MVKIRRVGVLITACLTLFLAGRMAWVEAGAPHPQAPKKDAAGGSSSIPRTSSMLRSKSGGLSPQALDELMAKEIEKFGVEPGLPLRDEDFLRRVFLDVTGRIPSAGRVEAFANDTNPRKRSRLIRELLDSPEYSRHWGRYWTDVVTYRTRGEDDHLKTDTLEDWFTRQVANNTPWNDVVKQLITAAGRNDESGPVNFILAQMARPEDLAAETARLFLGIQFQCAQCHDDPNGVWKRQQFHEFAAFFGRIDEERVGTGPEPKLPLGVKPPTPPFQVIVLDKVRKEYMMPDKDDASKATMILQPRALSGPPLPRGMNDAQRREQLAAWVTGPYNMWFPRAYVNRIWTQLMGSGFTKAVDDMGPDRPVLCPSVLYRVAAAWRTSGYDNRWLMELLLNSQTYQHTAPPTLSSEITQFAGVPPTRMQASQILDSIGVALDLDLRKLPESFRSRFVQTFEFDPSVPSAQVVATVSQSLLLMNDPTILNRLVLQSQSLVARLSADGNNSALIEALYLRALSRRPRPYEIEQCQAHFAEVADRGEAVEDLLWCLINSTEFVTKH